ncbi:MAG: 5-deoxy-glucuronate isomerase [Christensenellales bacterium]|jgi:5-deoxy-glucuronate isomerase
MALFKSKGLSYGVNTVVDSAKVKEAEMDFSVLLLRKDESKSFEFAKECALLLIQGKAIVKWQDKQEVIERPSCFKDNPVCLLLPSKVGFNIESLEDKTRFIIMTTENEKSFDPVFFSAQQCSSEMRGAGTLNECATRIVRSIVSRDVCPKSNFVMGEVVNYPGKWSSFPPHSHPHPEIYYYNFSPSENGYGITQDGDKAHIIEEGDALLALNGDLHPQVAAPGYAMFYVWVIRNSDADPYALPPSIDKHAWTIEPNVKFFPENE